MGLRVLDTGTIEDAALPVAQLAAQMRHSEGFAAVPGQDERLRLRLRAAIETLERRLGLILVARHIVLTGSGDGGSVLSLPITPVIGVVAVEEIRGEEAVIVDGAVTAGDPADPVLRLPASTGWASTLKVTVNAGWTEWSGVPGPLAQAALLAAEALDEGEEPMDSTLIRSLIAPWRRMRLGGRG